MNEMGAPDADPSVKMGLPVAYSYTPNRAGTPVSVKSFAEAVAFMNSVFMLAEKGNHHPNLTNVWTKVTIRYATHDAGGLTIKDFEMAEKIDKIA